MVWPVAGSVSWRFNPKDGQLQTFEFDGLVVDVEVASGEVEFVVFGFGLADFDLAESGVGRYGFDGLSFFVKELGYKDVACGVFGAPEVGVL